MISQVAGLLESIDGEKKMKAFNAIDITIEHKIVTLEVRVFLIIPLVAFILLSTNQFVFSVGR